MKLGVNWTSPTDLPLVRSLLADGSVDFCEILIDNFLQVPPERLAAAFEGRPVAFHVMNSRFLERGDSELAPLASAIRAAAVVLKPMYVSDHMGVFSHKGRLLPFLMELAYASDFARVRERVARWQELLGVALHLENFPSIFDEGREQPEFLQRLCAETGSRVLFDFSNAVVASRNCGVALAVWSPVIADAEHFHAAGYRVSDTEPAIVRDSHDTVLSLETLTFMRQSKALLRDSGASSLSIERDANLDRMAWLEDLAAARKALA